MNNKEQQKRFAQQSTIKTSEFNRLNTSQTEPLNPITKGNTLLPKDVDRINNTHNLSYYVIYAILSVVLFFGQWLIGKILLNKEMFSSTTFLMVVLSVSVILPEIALKIFYFVKKRPN